MSAEETKVAEATEEQPEVQPSGAPEDETPTESAAVEEGKAEPEESSGEDEEGKPKKEGGFQKRIRKLAAQRDAARAEAEYLRKQQMLDRPHEQKAEAAAESKPKPKMEDFDLGDGTYNHAAFTEAVAAWTADEAVKKFAADQETKTRQAQAQAEAQTLTQSFKKREAEFVKQVEDYDEVADTAIGILSEPTQASRAIGDALFTSEVGPEMLYYLGQNPDEAQRIAALSPLKAVMELGKLEAQLAEQEEKNPDKSETTAPPVSRAPKPMAPIKKPAGIPAFDPNDEKQALSMTAEEWAEKQRKRLAKMRK